jgi:hypothetical protein
MARDGKGSSTTTNCLKSAKRPVNKARPSRRSNPTFLLPLRLISLYIMAGESSAARRPSWLGANGEPLVVFHGTMGDFTEFNTQAKAHLGKLDTKLGSHFARSPRISDTFAGGTYAVAHDAYVDAYTPDRSWYRDGEGNIRLDGLFGYKANWDAPIEAYDSA